MLYINCYDANDKYIVASAAVKEPLFNREFVTFEVEDTSVFTFIAECLLENKTVSFAKDIKNPTINDLVVGEPNNLFNIKNLHIYKCINYFSRKTMNVPAFAFLEFQILNNELANNNIFITDVNREEKYLEVLEKNDPELLEILEKYLTVLSSVEQYRKQYFELVEATDRINSADNEKDIIDISNTYLKVAQ